MKRNFTCYSGKDVTLRMLWGAYRLDCQAYPNQFRGALACLSWRLKNPDIYSVVVDNATGRVVAYILVMAVTEQTYDKLVSGDFIDVNMKASDVVVPDRKGDYCLYISSMVVDRNFRKGIPGLMLFRHFRERLENYEKEGVHFSKVAADILSSDAEMIALHFGLTCLRESCHNSKIFVGNGLRFE